MPEEDKSKIDRLKDALYSRKVKIKPSFVLDLHGHQPVVSEKWQEPKPGESPLESKPKVDLSKKIFWGAIGFFAICSAVAGYIFIVGGNLISANNIKVDVLGPSSISAGDETALDIAVTNNNDTTLEIADLILEYPTGTRSVEDGLSPLSYVRVALGNIAPNQTVRQRVSSILYGEEGKSVHIPMTLEYRLPNSTSVFQKDLAYDGVVGSSPLTVSVEALKEVNAGQDYTLTINITSNSKSVERNIILEGDLPQGFDIVDVSPKQLSSGTQRQISWNLGDIEAGGKRVVKITGKIYGDKNEERYFKFAVGVSASQNKNALSATITSVTKTVDIKQPFIGVALFFDKSEVENYVAYSGTEVPAFIRWVNNLGVPVYDATIDAVVTGDIVDHDSIDASNGFYDSNKKILRWNQSYEKNLATLAPGSTGGVEFSFDLKDALSGAVVTNPEFTVNITVHAKRKLESGVPEDIVSTVQKTIKVLTNANLTSQIVHTTGPIENSGNIPPKVGEKTTYTVIWAVTNTFNKLSGAVVTATLPDYVTWENVVSPTSENISYNPTSREITWLLGNVDSQTASSPTVRQVAFQIGLLPSVSQVGASPKVLNIANFKASDTFTGLTITGTNKALNTELPTDPEYHFGYAQVQK